MVGFFKSGVAENESCTNRDRGRKQAVVDADGVGLFCLVERLSRGAEREEVCRWLRQRRSAFRGGWREKGRVRVEVFEKSKRGS